WRITIRTWASPNGKCLRSGGLQAEKTRERAGKVQERDSRVSFFRARTPGADASRLGFAVLVFLVPRHLDRFELRLVRRLGIVVEAFKPEDVRAQIREADGQGIEMGKFFDERDGDVFSVDPLHDPTSCLRETDFPS